MPVQSKNQICFVLPQFIKHLLCTVFCYLHFLFPDTDDENTENHF